MDPIRTIQLETPRAGGRAEPELWWTEAAAGPLPHAHAAFIGSIARLFGSRKGGRLPPPAPESPEEQEVARNLFEDFRTERDALREDFGANRRRALEDLGTEDARRAAFEGGFSGRGLAAGVTPTAGDTLALETGRRAAAGLRGDLAVNPALLRAFTLQRQRLLDSAARQGLGQTGTVTRDRLDKLDLEQGLASALAQFGILNEADQANLAGTSGLALRAATNPLGLAAALGARRLRPEGLARIGTAQQAGPVLAIGANRRGRTDQYLRDLFDQRQRRRQERLQAIDSLEREAAGLAGAIAGGVGGAGGGFPGSTSGFLRSNDLLMGL